MFYHIRPGKVYGTILKETIKFPGRKSCHPNISVEKINPN